MFTRKVRQYSEAGCNFEIALRTAIGGSSLPIRYAGLVFGSRGAIEKQTERLLLSLGITKKRLRYYSLRVTDLTLRVWYSYKKCT
jgi:hypothetical protein